MRKREIAAKRDQLARRLDQLRSKTVLPSDAELLVLPAQEWADLELSDAETVELSAALRVRARDKGMTMALLTSKLEQRAEEERAVMLSYRLRDFEEQQAAEELVGALWDLVPYGADRHARVEVLHRLWPQTPYQELHWDQLNELAAKLAASDGALGPLLVERLPQWATDAIGEREDEAVDEAEAVAQAVRRASDAQITEIDALVFRDQRLARFVSVFGAKGLRRLANSNRPAVTMAVCTSFLALDPDSADAQWKSFRPFMDRVEELVQFLEQAGNLDDDDFAGGPFAAQVSDLENRVIGDEALEAFSLRHRAQWDEELAQIGPLVDDQRIEAAGRAWDKCFSGIPALCDLVNDHLDRSDYRCEVDGELLYPPRRPRLGVAFISDDQIDEATSVELFCFGCEVLAGNPNALRVWLALWMGGLRPRESHVEGRDLVPYGRGFLVAVPRRFGKTGWREAMFPASAMKALGLSADHLFPYGTREPDPTKFAEEVCGKVRQAWEARRQDDPALAPVPGRKAYFPREVMADVIRRHQQVPWVLTKAYGHETEASDGAYTQITTLEATTMYDAVWDRLATLIVPSTGAGQ